MLNRSRVDRARRRRADKPRRRARLITRCAAVCAMATGLLFGMAVPANATLQVVTPDPAVPSTFVGHGGYSADGLGQDVPGGTVQAEVPAGSTVVRAYLYGTYYYSDSSLGEAERTIDFDGTTVVLGHPAQLRSRAAQA